MVLVDSVDVGAVVDNHTQLQPALFETARQQLLDFRASGQDQSSDADQSSSDEDGQHVPASLAKYRFHSRVQVCSIHMLPHIGVICLLAPMV